MSPNPTHRGTHSRSGTRRSPASDSRFPTSASRASSWTGLRGADGTSAWIDRCRRRVEPVWRHSDRPAAALPDGLGMAVSASFAPGGGARPIRAGSRLGAGHRRAGDRKSGGRDLVGGTDARGPRVHRGIRLNQGCARGSVLEPGDRDPRPSRLSNNRRGGRRGHRCARAWPCRRLTATNQEAAS